MLTVSGKTAPADATSLFVIYLCFTPLHSQEEVAIISVDAVLNLRPEEDPDGLIIYINSLAIFGHCDS